MLESLPLVFVLIGLALYVVLGGADFGAGFWQLFAGRGPHAERIREHAHAAMAPVWEANHVWLIFVLTVVWTAYPTAFASIASTLSIPLFIAAGSQFSSWLNPTSLLVGVLAVTTAAYLAAVFLCADATRLGDRGLEEQFR